MFELVRMNVRQLIRGLSVIFSMFNMLFVLFAVYITT